MSRRTALVGGAAVVLAAAATGAAVSRSDAGRQEPASVATDATTTTAQVVGADAPGAFAGSAQVSTTLAEATTSSAPAVTTTPAGVTTAPSTTVVPTTATTAGPGGDHLAVQAALDAAKARWAARKPLRGYTWRYTRQCFCPPPNRFEVDVDGSGKVTAVRGSMTYGTTTSSLAPPLSSGYTVESTFGRLQEAIDRPAASIRAIFDPTLGFPTDFFIDLDRRMVDEELGITNVSLTPRA